MEAGAEVREAEVDGEVTVALAEEVDQATGSVHLTNRTRTASRPLQTLFLLVRALLGNIREVPDQVIECLVFKEPVVQKQAQKVRHPLLRHHG